MQQKREISILWAAKFLSNIERPFSGCGREFLFKTIIKEVSFHKNIVLARSISYHICTLYTVYCTKYICHCIQYTMYYTVYNVRYSIQCTYVQYTVG